eukprot:UN00442
MGQQDIRQQSQAQSQAASAAAVNVPVATPKKPASNQVVSSGQLKQISAPMVQVEAQDDGWW